MGDFRPPDLARLGLSPLFLSFEGLWRAMEILAEILEARMASAGAQLDASA
ncbi:MAG: hypothetical protein ACREEX_03370 [Caulobacteraceae bacterium]